MLRTKSKRILRPSLLRLLACVAVFYGCGGSDDRPNASPLLDCPPAADSGVELRLNLLRDTISAKDTAPVEAVYVVANGGSETLFDNDPGRFSFKLQRADGRRVPPSRFAPPATGSWGSRVRLWLPARAMFAQVEDLRCIREGAGYGHLPLAPGDCLQEYDLRASGEYLVIVEYIGPTPGPDLDSLLADTTSVIDLEAPPPPGGMRLADTARLVVIP